MACMMEDATFKKMGRALSHPTGQMSAKPISLLVNPFTVSQIGIAFKTLKGALTDPACKVKALNEVKAGDHIVLRPKKANLVDRMMMGQHAIVQGVNREKNTILIIHYHSEVFKKKSNPQRLHVKSLVTGKVIQSKIRFNKGFDIYKINHESSSTVPVVLERAKARLGERDFNFFLNNDEHFAYFCKTGTPRSCRNKMYVLKMAQFSVKLYCLGQSIYLMLGLNSGVATYFYRRTTRVQAHTKKETAIKAKEMASTAVFYGFLNNWLLIRSTTAPDREPDIKDNVLQDGNLLQVAIRAPDSTRCQRRKKQKFIPKPAEDRQKAVELGSQLVARAVGQTLIKGVGQTVAKTGARHMAKEAMKKGIQSAAKKASEKVAHHAGKHALQHAAKGAAVKTAVTSAGKSSGHGVAGVLRAAARGQGLAIGMGALVSLGFATKDIIRAKKDIKAGEISADEYNNVVTRKVAGATTDIAMGTYGAVMGTMLAGPVGAVVGGFMGSMVGSMVGEEIGEELDKNDMGLRWAAKEGTEQDNMERAKITEIKDTSEMQKELEYPQTQKAEEFKAEKAESTLCETDANGKPPDGSKCKMHEELKPLTDTESKEIQATAGQGQVRDPWDWEPQEQVTDAKEPEVSELFGEYFDSMFNRKKTNTDEKKDTEQDGQSYVFARDLWGSFFGNTEDEDKDEMIAGNQSFNHSGCVKDEIQGSDQEFDKHESTGGLNQIQDIVTSMPEETQILPGELGSETGHTERVCSEGNTKYDEANAETPSEKSATKMLIIDSTDNVDQGDSPMDNVRSSPVTVTNGTNVKDKEGVETKNVPQGTKVTDSAAHGQQQATGFNFFGFGKTIFGQVISSIIQDVVSGDDQDTDNSTVDQGFGQKPPEDKAASKSSKGEESNEATRAEDIEDGKAAGDTMHRKATDGKALAVIAEREDDKDKRTEEDNTEGDDSDGNGDIVTSDSDSEGSNITIIVNADVHNEQNVTEPTENQQGGNTDGTLKEPDENTSVATHTHGSTCSQDIDSGNYQTDDTVTLNAPTEDSDAIVMKETATTDATLNNEGKDRPLLECSDYRADTLPMVEAIITPVVVSTDVILTIDEEEDEVTNPEAVGTEPNILETDSKSVGAELRVLGTEPKVVETEANDMRTKPEDVETDPKFEETYPKVVGTEPKSWGTDPTEPKAEEANPKVTETEPEDVETDPKVVETDSKVVETDSKVVETALKVVGTESKDEETGLEVVEMETKAEEANPIVMETEPEDVGADSLIVETALKVVKTDLKCVGAESKVVETGLEVVETEPKGEDTNPEVMETEPKKVGADSIITETGPKVVETALKVVGTESKVVESGLEVVEMEPKSEDGRRKVMEIEPEVVGTEAKDEETDHEDEENNSMYSAGESDPETHYMVDSDHILPRGNITDYYSIAWSVEAEDTGEVIETGLIEDEMTIRNIIKED